MDEGVLSMLSFRIIIIFFANEVASYLVFDIIDSNSLVGPSSTFAGAAGLD